MSDADPALPVRSRARLALLLASGGWWVVVFVALGGLAWLQPLLILAGTAVSLAGTLLAAWELRRRPRRPDWRVAVTALVFGTPMSLIFGASCVLTVLFLNVFGSPSEATHPTSTALEVSSPATHILTLPHVGQWRKMPDPDHGPLNALEVRRDPALAGAFLFERTDYDPGDYGMIRQADPPVRFVPAATDKLEPATPEQWERAPVVSTTGVPCSIRTSSGKRNASGCSPGGRYYTARASRELKRAAWGLLEAPPITLQSESLDVVRVSDNATIAHVAQMRSTWETATFVSWVGDDHLFVLWDDHPLVYGRGVDPDGPARVVWVDLQAADRATPPASGR